MISKPKYSEQISFGFIMLYIMAGVLSIKLFPATYSKLEIAYWRFPVFVVGAIYGKRITKGNTRKWVDYSILFIIVLVKAFQVVLNGNTGIFSTLLSLRVINSFWSIILILIIVSLLEYMQCEKINSILRKTGSISLELYLTHVTIRGICDLIGIRTYIWYVYLWVVLSSVLISLLLHKSCNLKKE